MYEKKIKILLDAKGGWETKSLTISPRNGDTPPPFASLLKRKTIALFASVKICVIKCSNLIICILALFTALIPTIFSPLQKKSQ